MAARHQLDRHIGDNVPALAKINGDAKARRSSVHTTVNLEESVRVSRMASSDL